MSVESFTSALGMTGTHNRAPNRTRGSKLTVLTFASFYLPGFRAGGPIRSISSLVDALGDDIEFRIVTADRDLGDQHPYPGLQADSWVPVGKALVRYLPPRQRNIFTYARLMHDTPHDCLYFNSFFDPRFTVQPLLARRFRLAPTSPVIIAPRGEFSEAALNLKAFKKAVFLKASRLMRLHTGITWHASSVYERDDVLRVFKHAYPNVQTASDIRLAPPLSTNLNGFGASSRRHAAGPLKLVFLSRISPMKNLLFALQALALVRQDVVFDIYGPQEDMAYWEKCNVAIGNLPSNIKVTVHGAVAAEDVVTKLASYNVLLLPTLGENFGHIIAEALQAGLRLIISDRTPWRGLAEANVGVDLPLDSVEAFTLAIEEEASRVPDGHEGERAIGFLKKVLKVDETLQANRQLFLQFRTDAGLQWQ